MVVIGVVVVLCFVLMYVERGGMVACSLARWLALESAVPWRCMLWPRLIATSTGLAAPASQGARTTGRTEKRARQPYSYSHEPYGGYLARTSRCSVLTHCHHSCCCHCCCW